MLYSVGTLYWKDAHEIIKAHEHRSDKGELTYDVPPDEAKVAMENINKGHEFMKKSLEKNPNYTDAYIYERILFKEESKLTADKAKKDELDKKAADMEEQARKIASQAKMAEASGGEPAK